MLKGDVRLTLKSGKTLKADSGNYSPVINFSSILKLLEYFMLPSLNMNLSISLR